MVTKFLASYIRDLTTVYVQRDALVVFYVPCPFLEGYIRADTKDTLALLKGAEKGSMVYGTLTHHNNSLGFTFEPKPPSGERHRIHKVVKVEDKGFKPHPLPSQLDALRDKQRTLPNCKGFKPFGPSRRSIGDRYREGGK